MHINTTNPNTVLWPATRSPKTSHVGSAAVTRLTALAMLALAGTAQAEDNTGTGGAITYTDSSGLNPAPTPYPGGYVVHKFTSSGTLTIPVPASADVLVVAGGGGGGKFGGGGGGGGLIYSSGFTIGAGSTSVAVGNGGAGSATGGVSGTNGGNSIFSSFTAVGGGGGGARKTTGSPFAGQTGNSGGSGGGGSPADGTTLGIGGSGTAGQGNNGGTETSYGWGGCGGGGAGAAGGNAAGNTAGHGGAGLANSISGAALYYAGGGGGCTYSGGSGTIGNGGLGGGGAGGKNASGVNGIANTGGGGGGGDVGAGQNGGTGGSGIVIVRYPYDSGTFSISLTSPANSQSLSSTASVSATARVFSATPPCTVKFYLDSNLVSTTNNAPNTVTVDLGVLPLGSHTLYATATDSTSATVTSATHTFTIDTDTTAPTPNPMTFASAPGQAGADSVAMTATTATDAWSPPVQYFFENTTNSNNSGWISGTTWTNTGLTAGSVYGYRVKARDAAGNETAWSGVASALLPLPGQVLQNFELVSAGSSSPPAGWSLFIVPGQSGSYTATTSGLGSNGAGGSGGLGGKMASSYTLFPGAYLVNSGFINGLDVRWAITGSYDLNMAGDPYGSCACLFGDIASGLPGTAGSLLEIVNKQSVFGNDPEQILNGAGAPLATLPSGGLRCAAGTWYRITFTWTPTIGTTGNFSYTVNAYSSGAWQPSYSNSVSGFTFANAQAYFGFGSMRAPSTIFDNINISGTAYGTPYDSDSDGMPNDWETARGLNPNDPGDASLNPDLDGLTNLQEYINGTNPQNADTDGDGLSDGAEVAGAGARLPTNPLLADTDGDGLNDLMESNTGIWVSATDTGTNPTKADTDLDGFKDGVETNTATFVSATNTGTNPLLADSDSDGAGDWYEVTATFTNPNIYSDKPNIPYPLPDPDESSGTTGSGAPPVKVYIMSGQSNMVGEGIINGTLLGTLDTIAKRENKFPNLLNGSSGWTTRNDVRYRGVVTAGGNALLTPGQGGTASKFGPELGFGHVMGYHHGEPVLLIKSSQGNRALGWDFRPPGSLRFDFTNNYTYPAYGESPERWLTGTTPVPIGWCAGFQYDQCFLNEADMSPIAAASGAAGINVTDVLDNFATQYPQWAAQGFVIAGYVWWQGNRDIGTGPPYTTNYEANMAQLIKQLRAYYANRYAGKCSTTTPFVLATGCGDPGTGGNGLVVANAQLAMNNNTKYPEFTGNVKAMDTRSYWRNTAISPTPDGYHYNGNAETFMLTGDALGRGMIALQSTTPPATDYQNWAALYPGKDLSNPNADLDGDGQTNNEERIWGLDPTSGASSNPITVPYNAATGTLTYTRRNQALNTGATFRYEWSGTLAQGSWQAFTPSNIAANGASPVESVTITLPVGLLGNPRLFVRVVATSN